MTSARRPDGSHSQEMEHKYTGPRHGPVPKQRGQLNILGALGVMLLLQCSILALASGDARQHTAAAGIYASTSDQTPAIGEEPGNTVSTEPKLAGKQLDDCVDTRIESLAPEDEAAQLILLGAPAVGGAVVPKLIAQRPPSGVFLVGRSRAGLIETARMVHGLQIVANNSGGHIGLFSAADQEGGQVQVLQGDGFSAMPTAVVQGQYSVSTLQDRAAVWGNELKRAGINVNLAPVADTVPIKLGKENAPIGRFDREYGTRSADVGSHVVAFIKGMRSAGIATAAKHFPGLGAVVGNTDYTAGVTDSLTTLDGAQSAPFVEAMRSGAEWVMISSAQYAKIDPGVPAVFSHIVMDHLRTAHSFDGIIASDDLGNAAQVKSYPEGERATRFIDAGGDLVLTGSMESYPEMVDAIVRRQKTDSEFAIKVRAAANRILRAKYSLGLWSCKGNQEPPRDSGPPQINKPR